MIPDIDRNHREFTEFTRFVEAVPLRPRASTDNAVLTRANTAGRPSFGAALLKLLAIQAAAGLVTLALCPQFGIGFTADHGPLHALHAFDQPALYYLGCGLLFVLFGAIFSGLAANRRDLKVLGTRRFAYFAGYSIGAYLVFQWLGTESFLLVTLYWIAGGLLGQLAGFGFGRRLKRVGG